MARSLRAAPNRRTALAMLGAGLLWSTLACAPKVAAQRTPGYDLESAHTYAWITEDLVLIQFGRDQPKVRTHDNERRIREAIDRALAARGLSKVPREEAQLLAAFSVGVSVRYRLEGGDGTAITTDGPGTAQTKGTLNIYLLDCEREKEVWHGSVSKWLSPNDDPDAVIDMAVDKIMSVYPGDAP